MKIRTGHVSNSSSSSFLLGVGKIKEMKAAKKLVDFSPQDFKIISTSELLEKTNRNWHYGPRIDLNLGEVVIESFNGVFVSTKAALGQEEFFLVMDHDGCHDDSDFSEYDHHGNWIGIDYNKIEMEWFSKEIKEQSEIFHKSEIIEDGHIKFGAGRNG